MKYISKDKLNKREEILNTFSEKELIDFTNKIISFSDVTSFLAKNQIEPSTENISDLATKNYDDRIKKGALTGLIGGGLLGGVYGAFKTHKNKKEKIKDMLKYGLIGAGLGGVGGGLVGTYSYDPNNTKDLVEAQAQASDAIVQHNDAVALEALKKAGMDADEIEKVKELTRGRTSEEMERILNTVKPGLIEKGVAAYNKMGRAIKDWQYSNPNNAEELLEAMENNPSAFK